MAAWLDFIETAQAGDNVVPEPVVEALAMVLTGEKRFGSKIFGNNDQSNSYNQSDN